MMEKNRYKVRASGSGFVVLKLTDYMGGLAWEPVRKTHTEAEAWEYIQKERKQK